MAQKNPRRAKSKDNRVNNGDYDKTQYTWCQSVAKIWILPQKYNLYLNFNIYTLQTLLLFVFEGVSGLK